MRAGVALRASAPLHCFRVRRRMLSNKVASFIRLQRMITCQTYKTGDFVERGMCRQAHTCNNLRCRLALTKAEPNSLAGPVDIGSWRHRREELGPAAHHVPHRTPLVLTVLDDAFKALPVVS